VYAFELDAASAGRRRCPRASGGVRDLEGFASAVRGYVLEETMRLALGQVRWRKSQGARSFTRAVWRAARSAGRR